MKTYWCLSPEQSLVLQGGNRTVPPQLVVRTPKGGNKPTALPHGTSLFDVRNAMPNEGAYMRALESASAKQDITPFAEFVALVQDRLDGEPAPDVPQSPRA